MDLDIKHLARLARIKLTDDEGKRFSRDLGKILDHFKELQTLDTREVEPFTGSGELKNVYRDDQVELSQNQGAELRTSFPEKERDFLKIPAVFGEEQTG